MYFKKKFKTLWTKLKKLIELVYAIWIIIFLFGAACGVALNIWEFFGWSFNSFMWFCGAMAIWMAAIWAMLSHDLY